MCGIAGILSFGAFSGEQVLRSMTDSLAHRGPDDFDTWSDREAGVGLGHRRLSIIDPSPLGRQPMHSACGRYVMVFNGEVYNFREMRSELERLGHTFRGGSDTEVLLASIVEWGLETAVSSFVGMFTIALWDRRERALSLVRDRLGIKPLYYGWAGKNFVFGSELKALCACPDFSREIDRDALSLYFRNNYIPAPWTIYRKALKLGQGCILTLCAADEEPTIKPFWSALDVWNNGAQSPFAGSMDDAVESLDELLDEAVRMRMVADVPLGALLSGGIDSSAVVALMQKNCSQPIRTFSIGFQEAQYNEAVHAKAVADHLGTDHTELYITAKDMLEAIPHLPSYWDEPFADSSQIPTFFVSRLTRNHVTVALSGDGGDELFAGYQRYFWGENWDRVEKIPLWLRKMLTPFSQAIPGRGYDLLGTAGFKARLRMDMLAIRDFDAFYRYFMSHDNRPTDLVLGAMEPASPMTLQYDMQFEDRFKRMTFWDTVAYLPDDILVKTDRASMAHSLELRVPILDHRVVGFAASLPSSYKIQDGVGKQVLRRLLYRYVPQEIVDRPKMGFGVPVQEWLQADLKEWCCDMLDGMRIRQQGYLNAPRVEQMVSRFMKGEVQWTQQLWNMLMFQAWLEEWK